MDYATIFGTLQTSLSGAIEDIVPVALVVGGSVLAITLGWKLFKRFVK